MGSPLSLSAEQMRALGYRTIDMLVDRLTGEPGPVVQARTPEELRARLATPPPAEPAGFEEILATLERDVLPFVARISHPGYLAYIPGEGTWPGVMGDLIASALNVDTCWWLGSSGPSALELVVLDWFRQWIGYPEGAAGVLVSGGSAANLTALACAREARVGAMDGSAVVYMSDQTHSSVARGARALGFRPENVRIIPTDEYARLRVDALASALEADRAAGLTPLAVVANAGTTATGAVDPLATLSELCAAHRVWLHVDGAYGAFAVLSERGRASLQGIELADSVTLDPHKWLYQPIEVGALLVRDGVLLRRGFEIGAEYLEGIEAGDVEVNFSDFGLQLTRSARALKLWMSLRYFGVDAFRDAIDAAIDLALHAQRTIEASPELELLSKASLGVVTFRRRPDGVEDEAVLERINAELAGEIERDGEVFISTARVRGRFALRLCILNFSTTQAHVDRALDLAATLAVDTAPAPSAATQTSYAPLAEGWLRRARVDEEALRALPLFADCDMDAVLRDAREHHAVAGEPIVEQWEVSRDLYVVLEGRVHVTVEDEIVRELGPGEFFGEVAALDWGAGFGRTRTATVTASEPTRLLVLDWQLVARLAASAPRFKGSLESASKERLRPARS
jgi:glutamate/tyrosine decarboxylase-like PLP-dependent enzyme